MVVKAAAHAKSYANVEHWINTESQGALCYGGILRKASPFTPTLRCWEATVLFSGSAASCPCGAEVMVGQVQQPNM